MGSLLSQLTGDAIAEVETRPTPPRRRGVLLINLGSPDRPDVPSVCRYLAEFLSDPAVIQLPAGLGWLNGVLGRLIARFRAPRSAKMYQRTWTQRGSPLKVITEDQTSALETLLPRGWRVFHAMRYGRPGIADTLRTIESAGIDELVVLPMYPQFSGPTTGTALRVLYGHLKAAGHQVHVTTRNAWFDDHGYINAQTALIEEYAGSNQLSPDNAFLLFSAHGLPMSYARRGDPYPGHVARTAGLVGRRLGWPTDRMTVAYQGRFGPTEWLKPYADEVLMDLARTGEKRVLVCPISFTADCLETLEEIDIRYRAMLEEAGAELYLCPALNTYAPFISALKHLVLRGPRPVTSGVKELRQFKPARHDTAPQDGIDSLVMIGMSLRGRVSNGRGPLLTYTDGDGLRRVKRSQCQVPALLRNILEQTDVREALLWNTCHRFEFYGRLDRTGEDTNSACTVAEIRRHLFGDDETAGKHVNVLFGADAWHHLLRTALGLNSGLPGERDILGQLQAAHRLADRAGTAGPLTRRLIDDVTAFDRDLRSTTEWGRYDPDYCHAAFSRIVDPTKLDLTQCRIVVIGGSTTSAAVLRTLIERFHVPSRQLTLFYRGHKSGGQIKMLRRAIGNGRRVRVQSYAERSVIRGVVDADVVVFGVDRHEAVLDADQIHDTRDWRQRPLTIFDFNMFGSTSGMESLEGITLHRAERLETEVGAFADRMCATEEFARTFEAAEIKVVERVLASNGRGGVAGSLAAVDAGVTLPPTHVEPPPGRYAIGADARNKAATTVTASSLS
ncbi:MAG: ferrochelatase [Phycisphaerae bacterium]